MPKPTVFSKLWCLEYFYKMNFDQSARPEALALLQWRKNVSLHHLVHNLLFVLYLRRQILQAPQLPLKLFIYY